MKNIADLVLRVWQGSQPVSNTQVAVMAENRDRSRMADFVRILQAYDQGFLRTWMPASRGSLITLWLSMSWRLGERTKSHKDRPS
jgi:hypothetical protein